MLDDYKDKQHVAYNIMYNTIKKEKYSHAYLIETNGSHEGMNVALAFAKALLCPKKNTTKENCEECNLCQTIDSGNAIEVKIINADGLWIKKDQINDLQQEFSRKAIIGQKKIYIINGVEKLNIASANSILKFLEEPEEGIIAILITGNISQVLETIVSRCLIIPLKKEKDVQYNSTIEALDKLLFINDEKNFSNNPQKCDIILKLLNFVIYYEEKGISTIAHLPQLLEGIYDNKEDSELFFDILTLIYKDVLNVKCGGQAQYFFDYKEKIDKLINMISINKICERITLIIKAKEKLKINANFNLLVDNLLIDMKEGE